MNESRKMPGSLDTKRELLAETPRSPSPEPFSAQITQRNNQESEFSPEAKRIDLFVKSQASVPIADTLAPTPVFKKSLMKQLKEQQDDFKESEDFVSETDSDEGEPETKQED
jgi:hypothetical protein